MLKDTRYFVAFAQLEEQTGISRHLSQIVNSFFYHMYRWKGERFN